MLQPVAAFDSEENQRKENQFEMQKHGNEINGRMEMIFAFMFYVVVLRR